MSIGLEFFARFPEYKLKHLRIKHLGIKQLGPPLT